MPYQTNRMTVRISKRGHTHDTGGEGNVPRCGLRASKVTTLLGPGIVTCGKCAITTGLDYKAML